MRFISIQIKNYKSFDESQKIRLASGRNVVVGQNNSGKTALLEAISLTFGREPHKTSRRPRGFPVPDLSDVLFDFALSGTEMKKVLLAAGSQLHLPLPTDRGPRSDPQEWLREMFVKPE